MLQTNHSWRISGLPPAHERSVRAGPTALSNKVGVFLLTALAVYGFALAENEPALDTHARSVSIPHSTPLAAPFNRPIDLASLCDERTPCMPPGECDGSSAFTKGCPSPTLSHGEDSVRCQEPWCRMTAGR